MHTTQIGSEALWCARDSQYRSIVTPGPPPPPAYTSGLVPPRRSLRTHRLFSLQSCPSRSRTGTQRVTFVTLAAYQLALITLADRAFPSQACGPIAAQSWCCTAAPVTPCAVSRRSSRRRPPQSRLLARSSVRSMVSRRLFLAAPVALAAAGGSSGTTWSVEFRVR